MQQQGAQVSMPNDREVEVTRTFRAPRTLVYEAYTKPELVQQWLLGPPGWTMPVCEMDVRVGGRFRWRWRSEEDGKEFGFEGEYLDVQPATLLRNTESFDSGDIGGSMGEKPAMVTVRFHERNGTTTLTTLIEYASKQDRDAAVSTGMTDGMESSYKLLDDVLAERPVQRKPI
ncbi:MAG TPA: SRPBCC family protein [Longimicrobiales bacterium]|nr:SRPBCC family protein [Longimicrobiales bacterium]